ncbi:cell division protein SepF [Blautia sp. MSJ-19]|uniref:cell division protein SepF n=1 Tax=Blautia sp. MSJ-19 TaxID=2841517 RepID=UPI001C0F2486|nr:cell division protein SepF [Blautia sp. MSJ-19]MBU5481483.1 cell division protein SepF [Blautia sp. MSJ-19]
MSVLNKLLDAVKLNDDYDEDDYLDDDLLDEDDDDFLDDEQEDKPVKKFFQKFGKKNNDDEEFDDFDEEEEPELNLSKQTPKSVSTPKVTVKQEKPVRNTSSKITPMRSSRKGGQTANMEVCVIRPTSMEDTRDIADTLVHNSTVILNLEGIDMELAQRIIDFTSGACYSLNGSLQKVSSYIFILGPSNVDITGDLQSILGGHSNIPSVRAGY